MGNALDTGRNTMKSNRLAKVCCLLALAIGAGAALAAPVRYTNQS